MIIASSRENELSYSGSTYGIFTECLLEALQGQATLNKDNYICILEILSYLFEQVPKKAPRPQHPFVNKVYGLGDNFPICYYPGGNENLSRDTVVKIDLTTGQKRRLEQKRDTLQMEWDIRSKKIKLMREDLAIEAGTAVKFQLEQQLLNEEKILAVLTDELDEIEAKLQL